MAERANVSRGVIVRLEAGDPGVSIDGLVRVLGAIQIPERLDQLLDPMNTDIGRARLRGSIYRNVGGR